MPSMSHESARPAHEFHTIVESTVCAIKREIRIPEAVYNIAVADNHNYFASGILVHNCDLLMAVTDGHLTRVIANVSPGSMKSLALNVFFPAWEWGPCRRPTKRYLSLAYSEGLTTRDNSRFLALISDPVYQSCWPHVVVTKEGVNKIENNRTGWKQAGSVNGATTGFRADRILLDDPNDPRSVESKTIRDGTNHFLREVMPSRLNNLTKDAIICIQQRTHAEDATGTLSKLWKDFSWLCIPMEFDPLRIFPVVLRRDKATGAPSDVWIDPRALDGNGDELEGLIVNERGEPALRMGSPMAHVEGELAWPDRFPREAVEEQKRVLGAYAYANQYQQLSTVRGGGIIRRDWWQSWNSPKYPDMGTVIASLDTAYEEHQDADYNALTVWGAFPGPQGEPKLMLIDAWRDRLPLAQLITKIANTCKLKRVDYLLIEHKSRGRDVHDEIKRVYAGDQRASWQTILVKIPSVDKESRLNAVSHLFSGDVRQDPVTKMDVWSGGIIFAPNTTWAEEVIEEVQSFPRGAHDDYPDSVSLALSWIRKQGVVLRKVEFDYEEEKRKLFKPTPEVPYSIRRS